MQWVATWLYDGIGYDGEVVSLPEQPKLGDVLNALNPADPFEDPRLGGEYGLLHLDDANGRDSVRLEMTRA